ncbi:glycosyltransferase family 2 protein [Candidatus Pacearchaeota archaeon]|nr:glycosyltransferase family 2 protein [Candidatus Pacearchaeota archaeon]
MTIKLSIALVNWNSCDLTRNCIESIIRNVDDIPYEIIVVDNNSTDGSIQMIENNFPNAILIKNKDNLGFAEANNQAFDVSQGEYFLLLNTDTIVHDKAIQKMIGFLEQNPKVGAVTCKLLNSDGSIQYNMHRTFPTFIKIISGFIYKNLGLRSKWAEDYLMLNNQFDKTEKIEQAAGACILLETETLNEIGGLFDSQKYPLYFNDVDLCYRLYKNGFPVYLMHDAVITHLKGQSIKKLNFFKNKKELFISTLLFFKTHGKYVDYLLYKLFTLFFYFIMIFISFVNLLLKKTDAKSFNYVCISFLSILMEKSE